MYRIRFAAFAIALVGTLGATSADAATFSWGQVQLTGASGVPAQTKHAFAFKGIVEGRGTKSTTDVSFSLDTHPIQVSSTTSNTVFATIWVEGKGSWDEQTKEATEKFRLDGDMRGEFVSRLKCTQDPWLGPSSCAVLTAQMEVTHGPIYDWPGMVKKAKLPLSSKAVDPALAAELSKKSDTAAPPPPPVPKVAGGATAKQGALQPGAPAAFGTPGTAPGSPAPHSADRGQAPSRMERTGTPDWNAAVGSAAPVQQTPPMATAKGPAAPAAGATAERELAQVSCARTGGDGSRFRCTTRAGLARCEALRAQRQVDQCTLGESQASR